MKLPLLLVLWSIGPILNAATAKEVHEQQLQKASDVSALPVAEGRLFLYSLNPAGGTRYTVNTKKVFHGFKILGKAEVKSLADRRALLAAFSNGIRESDGGVAACFEPRHGLRLIVDSSTYDFVICFECRQVVAYGFAQYPDFLTAPSPYPVFNKFIDRFHLKKAR